MIIIIIIVLQLSKNVNQLVLIYISWKKKEKRFKQRRAAAARVRLLSLQTQAACINLCDHLSLHAHKLTPAAQSASTGISIGLLIIRMGSFSSQTFVSSWFVAAVREMEHTSKPHYPALTGPTGCIMSNGASSVYSFSQGFIYIYSRQSKRRKNFTPKAFWASESVRLGVCSRSLRFQHQTQRHSDHREVIYRGQMSPFDNVNCSLVKLHSSLHSKTTGISIQLQSLS